MTPKERFEELKQEIEYRKSELAKKGRYANFDFRIKVVEAEMKGITETMEYMFKNKFHKLQFNINAFPDDDLLKWK